MSRAKYEMVVGQRFDVDQPQLTYLPPTYLEGMWFDAGWMSQLGMPRAPIITSGVWSARFNGGSYR